MIPPKPRAPVELTSRGLRVVRAATDRSPRVLVTVAARVPLEDHLRRCLRSIEEQVGVECGVVLLLDGVDAGEHAVDLRLPASLEARTWVLAAHCGTAARARNAILDFVDERIPGASWTARLDADDTFAGPGALGAAVRLGDRAGSAAVLGGNRVLSQAGVHLRDNPAHGGLRGRDELLRLLHQMADGTAPNELPSCNLLLRARSGVRYPDMRSAEDHWLVASLLFHRPADVAILARPLMVDYRLDGRATRDARLGDRHRRARRSLHLAAETWERVAALPGEVLGFGQEGIIRLHHGEVIKHFYPGALTDEQVAWLRGALVTPGATPAPEFEWEEARGAWLARYPHEETRPFTEPDPAAVRAFLRACLEREIVCANVKRSNFRVRPSGELVYVDVGSWIIPMHVSYFRDAAARLFSIGVLGAPDEELQRRPTDPTRPVIWETLAGFRELYREVVGGWIEGLWGDAAPAAGPGGLVASDVTLLLKACAMDARDLRAQVVHLVDQLSQPRAFARRVLVIDPFEGPFLRQHDAGDLQGVVSAARDLVERGLLDDVLVSPADPAEVRAINRRWFGVDVGHSHSADGVPVTPQVWAFEQVGTRYVLQADVDVLVGRRELGHDYLDEMVRACAPEDVVCVAFNIPHRPGRRPYAAPPGEHKPEVRLGLLDLHRLKGQRPLPGGVDGDRLTTTWYRALHRAQRERGLRTVRGGDSATFYLHPPNERKSDAAALARVRDLVAQGWVPPSQLGRWDVEAPPEEWRYAARREPVVVLALGRDTPPWKLRRFSRGLAMQEFQGFGVVVIDDASQDASPSRFLRELSWLGPRLTLVRNSERLGRVDNYRRGVTSLCVDGDTMVVVVDQDDALAHPAALRELHEAGERGHDVVWAAPFRPDAPLRIYEPEPSRAREAFGGDVWIHLRAFRKRLFDGLSGAALELDGVPLESLVDYATMVPIVERARDPLFLPRYRYWHERSTVLDAAGERDRDRTILRILAKGPEGAER